MNGQEQQTITPERQAAAAQIGAVFNSIHQYVRTLENKDHDGNALLTKQLEFSHQRIDEAAMWAIKHALSYGVPAPAAPAANDEKQAPVATDATAETPAPIGVVDPLPTVHASGAEAV